MWEESGTGARGAVQGGGGGGGPGGGGGCCVSDGGGWGCRRDASAPKSPCPAVPDRRDVPRFDRQTLKFSV